MKRLISLLALLTLVLSGCATIPRSGMIGYGTDIGSGLTGDNLYYSPTGPDDGEPQGTILPGFLNAGNGPQNDYAVARMFLTKQLAVAWQPSKEVLIQVGEPEFNYQDDGVVYATIRTIARVDEDGRYFDLPAGSTRTLKYRIKSVAGQWRISEAPNLTVLISPNFKVLFRAYSLYFFDNARKYLVPEMRWFPSRVSTGTRMMNALLKGPSDWLAPSVSAIIPAGTKLNINSVITTDGVAKVDLTAAALKLSKAKRALMKAQISATLVQLPDVERVEISIQQSPMDIANGPTGEVEVANTTPVALTDSGLYHFGVTGMELIYGTANKVAATGARDFAFDTKEQNLVLTGLSGSYRYSMTTFGSRPIAIDNRENQLSPAIDNFGWAWTLTGEASSELRAFKDTSKVVSNTWFGDATPVDFALSEEGSRLASVYYANDTYSTYVQAVHRDNTGRPLYLGAPRRVDSASGAIDVSWANSNALLTLVPAAGDSVVPWLSEIGGQSKNITVVQGAYAAISNRVGQIYVLKQNREVVTLREVTWSFLSRGVSAIHISGR